MPDLTNGDAHMKLSVLGSAATAVLIAFAGPLPEASAKEKTVMVGGAAMYPSKTIVANAVNSKDHTTLVAGCRSPLCPRSSKRPMRQW